MPSIFMSPVFSGSSSIVEQWRARNQGSVLARSMAAFAGANNPVPGSGGAPATGERPSFSGSRTRADFMPSGNNFGGLDFGGGTRQEFMANNIPSFAEGGLMTEQGTALRPGERMPPPGQMSEQPDMALGNSGLTDSQMTADINRLGNDRQLMQKIRAILEQAVNSGEVSPQELNMIVQLAKMALNDPSTYPQIRSFAIQNGLATEEELPQKYDQGLVYVLLLAGKAMQKQLGGGGSAPTGVQAQATAESSMPDAGELPSYNKGGPTGKKAHLAVVHADEYVIPKDVVMHYGTKFLEGLVEKARTPPGDKNGGT